MEHSQLISSLKNYGEITLEDESNIRKYFQFHNAKKKEILISKGAPCNKLFFVNKGLLRAFFTDEKEFIITRMIAPENTFLTNIASFRNLASNIEIIECIENAKILYIDKKDFTTLMANSKTMKGVYCEILERYNVAHVERFHHLSVSGIRTKIELLKENHPYLLNRVSDSVLASFLGVTREYFAAHKHLLY